MLHLKDETQRQLLTLFEQSPVGLVTYSADETSVIQWANPFYGALVGRPPHALVGKPLLEALPELKGQGFDELLKKVIATGVPFIASEVEIHIRRHDQLTTSYVDLTYQPQRGTQGGIADILVVAIDVTPQVMSRKKVEDSEARFRSLVEEAPVATCLFVGRQMTIEVANTAMIDVWGKGPAVMGMPLATALPELQGQPFLPLLDELFTTGNTHTNKAGRADLVVEGRLNTFYFDYTFKPLRDPAGQVYAILETAVDVTEQVVSQQALRRSEERYRQLSVALEQQVRQRTQDLLVTNEKLAATNKELAANNDEYVAINKELEEANRLLNHSNDNLQQFAYVASHDLQEPLRKIQSVADLLKGQFGNQLGEGVNYLNRMQLAANRMSILIRDLLAYSRITTQRSTHAPVSLQEGVSKVLTDLELVIEETGAHVQVELLPGLPGDALQLGQLFQNLLSNALKFARREVSPRIEIHSRLIAAEQLPATVTPSRPSSIYHRIDVADNGIGFDEKYLDRIFRVFQRLQGRSESAGTGIGLAICEKVAANHGGAITATSQPGQGATFSVYLPG